MIPNAYRVMAHAPSLLAAFMQMQQSLSFGSLPRSFQQQIAVLVAQFDRSSYCLSLNTAVGLAVGLSDKELEQAREGRASDPKWAAGLTFAAEVLQRRGSVDDEATRSLATAGFTPQEIVETLGNIGFNLFANYLNLVAQTGPDAPAVALDRGVAKS